MFDTLKSFFFYTDLEKQLLSVNADSTLIQKHSSLKNVVVNDVKLRLRIFNLDHHKSHKLPDLPTVVFLHGLGGQVNQFEPLIDYFSHFASVIACDLPGHGQSEPTSEFRVYSPEFFIDILEKVITTELHEHNNGEVILIGHSMGSILAGKLANRFNGYRDEPSVVRAAAVIMLCAPGMVDPAVERNRWILAHLPIFVGDVLRALDRKGGIRSPSVGRMLGDDPSDELRTKQLRWNLQVQTGPVLATAAQFHALTNDEISELVHTPTFFIGTKEDRITPPTPHQDHLYAVIKDAAAKADNPAEHKYLVVEGSGHAIMSELPEYTCGVIGDFINEFVSSKLSLAWQLAHLASKSDKWSLKNEGKWRKVQPVGDVIQGSRLRGIKTLRQDDDTHSPVLLEKAHPEIVAVVDISREEPPYDPTTFSRIKYYKFPTVSKIPPSQEEVSKFIELIDQVQKDFPDPKTSIGVHCHYGFNRTGFFLSSYLIEKYGISVKDAVARFASSRDPGIKHPHFIDELYVRYSHIGVSVKDTITKL